MKKILLLGFMCLLSHSIQAKETLSFGNEVMLKVNIKEPICKISSLSKQVDFGELDRNDILSNPPESNVTFSFTDCSGVQYINIDFIGNYIDSTNNLLKIAEGANYASGVAIKLYENSAKEVKLSETNKLYIGGATNHNLVLKAKVIPLNPLQTNITPGDIKSSVALLISYE